MCLQRHKAKHVSLCFIISYKSHICTHTHIRELTQRRKEGEENNEWTSAPKVPRFSFLQDGKHLSLKHPLSFFFLSSMSCRSSSGIVATHLSFHQYLLQQKKRIGFKLSIAPLQSPCSPHTLSLTQTHTHRHELNGFIRNASYEKYNTVSDTLLPVPLVHTSF